MFTGVSDAAGAADALRSAGPSQVVIKLGPAGCLARIGDQTFEVPRRW
jgi:sugar/nucleoside kinase (ribokinase family)